MIVHRTILTSLLLLATGAAPSMAAERVREPGAAWCEHREILQPFLRELVAHPNVVLDEFPTCLVFKAGLRVETLAEVLDVGNGVKVVAVRVHVGDIAEEGFTLNRFIETVP